MTMLNVAGMLPRVDNMVDYCVQPGSVFDLSEDKWTMDSHLAAVAFHHTEVRANGGCEVSFVDDQ